MRSLYTQDRNSWGTTALLLDAVWLCLASSSVKPSSVVLTLSANRAERCSILRCKFQDPWRRSLAAACAFCLSQLWRLQTWMSVPAPSSSAESSVTARVGKLGNRHHPCSPFRSGHTALDVVAKNKSVAYIQQGARSWASSTFVGISSLLLHGPLLLLLYSQLH